MGNSKQTGDNWQKEYSKSQLTANNQKQEQIKKAADSRQQEARSEEEGSRQQNGDSWQQEQRKKAADNKMETACSNSREKRQLTTKWRQLAAEAEKEGG